MGDVIIDQLDGLGAAYEVVDCDPDLADTAQFCEAYGYELSDSANTIIVVGKADPRLYAACVVLGISRLDVNGVVRKRFGTRKASFASAEETGELTGMAIGGVTVLGLPAELPVWVDQGVMERERIILGGGNRSRKILARPDLLAELPNVTIIEGLAKSP